MTDKPQFDLSPEDIKVFLDEADEVLQLLDEGILKLEQEGEDLETIQEIFRAAHTLKGSSATIGHTKMAELTHHIENVFDKLRNGETTVTTVLIDALLTSLDMLRRFKDDIANGKQSTEDCSEIIEALTGTASAAKDLSLANENKAGELVADETFQDFQDIVNSEEIKGNKILSVDFRIDKTCAMPAVRAFQVFEELANLGRILQTQPTEQQITDGTCGFKCSAIISTKETDTHLKTSVNSVSDIVEVCVKTFKVNDGGQANGAQADSSEQSLGKKTQPSSQEKDAKLSEKQTRTVRVDVERLDKLMNLVGELVISRTQLYQISDYLLLGDSNSKARKALIEASTQIGKITNDLQEEIVKARMFPIERVFSKFPRMVRDLARRCEKNINFVITGKETELDRSVIEEIGDPLIHILRNAIDHGIESASDRKKAGKPVQATVKLSARHQEGQILIEVEDDGRGIDVERIKSKAIENGLISQDQAARMSDQDAVQLIFYSGVSTAKEVTQLSGRGVGMDIVRSNIEKINGSIEVSTVLGVGSRFTIKLPLTLAIIQALLVNVSNNTYAIPLGLVVETMKLLKNDIKYVNKRETIILRGSVLPLLRLSSVFNYHGNGHDKAFVVIATFGGIKVGLVVDDLIGEREIVVKTLGNYISSAKGISGATILGDGKVALIVDVPCLIEMIIREQRNASAHEEVT